MLVGRVYVSALKWPLKADPASRGEAVVRLFVDVKEPKKADKKGREPESVAAILMQH